MNSKLGACQPAPWLGEYAAGATYGTCNRSAALRFTASGRRSYDRVTSAEAWARMRDTTPTSAPVSSEAAEGSRRALHDLATQRAEVDCPGAETRTKQRRRRPAAPRTPRGQHRRAAKQGGLMASIEKRNGRWRARYRTPDGRSASKAFGRRSDADLFLTGVEHSKLSGLFVDPVAGRVTFKEYAEAWRRVRCNSDRRQPRSSRLAFVATRIRCSPIDSSCRSGRQRFRRGWRVSS